MIKEERNKHYFTVEVIEINKENESLLNEKKVKEYLSFISPVDYSNKFIMKSKIYEYAKSINYKIDTYNISVNGELIYKNYTTRLKEKREVEGNNKGVITVYDEVEELEFNNYLDDKGKLLAWGWVGLSRFEKQIPKINYQRGLRLRCKNIQLGGDDTLKGFFKEERGNYYFIGEVFSVSKELLPNSQRNNFNENEARQQFNNAVKTYFYETLHILYTHPNKYSNLVLNYLLL